jgi:hypothetical protein
MSGKRAHISALTSAIFGDETSPSAAQCAAWMSVSAPFLAFVETHETKIRKKVRGAQDDEGLRDVAFELSTAAWLLHDRRVSIGYERYLAEKARGPDFTVTFKGHIVFNVEVRRLRAAATAERVIDVVCEKAGQMPPGVTNVLVIGCEGATPDLDAAVKRLRTLAEGKQDAFFTARGWRDARGFLRAWPRLGAVVLRAALADIGSAARPAVWLNRAAKHPVAVEVQKLLQHHLTEAT